jgi:spermidine synthase
VDCVELSPEVLAAAPLFAKDNGGATANPKGNIILGDGREHLLSTDESYDLISLEPPPPRFAGVVNLYSVDFYQLCRRRLRPGGVMAQWIPMHSHTVEEMRDLIRSFVEVFPESTFWVPTLRDGILVGSASPLKVSAEDLRSRIGMEPVASDLKSIDIGDLGALLGPLMLDPPAVRSYSRRAHLITDDRPSIEYFAGHGLIERPGHLEDVLRFGINPGKWLEEAGGGRPVTFTPQEIRHLEAIQQILLGGVAGDRGDLEGKKRAYAAALLLDPGSIFIHRLNIITGTPEE